MILRSIVAPCARRKGADGMRQRFEQIYAQDSTAQTEIWVDRETGVHYLFHRVGCAAGVTPLLDRNGKPVVLKK